MNLGRVPIIVWFLVPTAILIGLGVWFLTSSSFIQPQDKTKPAEVSNSIEGVQEFDIVGENHIPQGTPGSGYNSNPPSSGPHWPSPAVKGVFDKPMPDETALHNLEHGHIWIAYDPSISEEVKTKLAETAQNDDWKIIMSPREGNDAKIALVAWGRVLNMDEPDFARVEDFIKTYRNRGPEKTPE
ncbi:hypothetical protein A3D04_02125 [Candidatus Curtissbacteria bacterium RIFCSPHIGHO2_02_FULL_40_16b]|uniref:DUF3105 domain-containing protein n=1 Tax=Candidatus Curtissbacteria bacterium RIFCSPHIGHO2_02_FULL_40_16b TaxID=1797714 RepID=A0A1F5GC91_9BACT|nr:MAG: hypothetical protein A3D04_02125 [Candidatus Curtissbacteria bacterium RIFCSPHIGHO2_02_FULL_40_16b]